MQESFGKLRDTIIQSDEAYDRLLAVLQASISKASTTNPAMASDTIETARSFLESIGLADRFDEDRFRKAAIEKLPLHDITTDIDLPILQEIPPDEQALEEYLQPEEKSSEVYSVAGDMLIKFLADSYQAEWIRLNDPKQYEERQQKEGMPSELLDFTDLTKRKWIVLCIGDWLNGFDPFGKFQLLFSLLP